LQQSEGEMMDKRQIREEAWGEGANAMHKRRGGDVLVNPYAPVVEFTPDLMQVNEALLGAFTQDEIWRYQMQRDYDIAEFERKRVMDHIEVMQRQENQYRPRTPGSLVNTWNEGVDTCVKLVKRMKPSFNLDPKTPLRFDPRGGTNG
jgi:hypothetical protein